MIPAVIDPETKSPGERQLFAMLKDDLDSSDWQVLHSLDIANHTQRAAGEIDYVIVVPGLGVLCVEVKAHRNVRRSKAGMWHLGSESPSPRGPFKQASEAMHSLREAVVRRHPTLGSVPFCSAVFFTNTNFDYVSPQEWHRWQVADYARLKARPISNTVKSILNSARSHIASKRSGAWFDPTATEPSTEQVNQILLTLRPQFEYFESPKARRLEQEQELFLYTSQQYIALDGMDSPANPRIVFEGAAGTGKTLLAIEQARRAVVAGNKVLFCCYNKLLADWLSDALSPLGDKVRSGTLHSFMTAISGADIPQNAESTWWEETLPSLAADALLGSEDKIGAYDLLILDEAQDLLSNRYLDIFDLMLDGGLCTGRWRFFGDFKHQALYGNSAGLPLDLIAQRAESVATFNLTNNCRNPPRVAAYGEYLGGTRGYYSDVLRPDTGIEPKTIYYRDKSEQSRLFVDLLDELYESGYRGQDLAVLSYRSEGSVSQTISSEPWRSRLTPAAARRSEGKFKYSTIHAFKGLEASVIIVTDVDTVGDARSKDLFYVAVTRATEKLYVLAQESVKQDVLDALVNG